MSSPSDSVPAVQSQIDNRQSAMARTQSARSAERCVHVKQNGVRCGSPAMRNHPWCYFHDRYYNRPYEDSFPVLEDGNAIQIALMQVFDGLRSGRLDRLTAQTYIYGLRVAALINRQANFSPHPSRIVLEDPLVSDKAGIPTIPIPEVLPSVQASAATAFRVPEGRQKPAQRFSAGKETGREAHLAAAGSRAGATAAPTALAAARGSTRLQSGENPAGEARLRSAALVDPRLQPGAQATQARSGPRAGRRGDRSAMNPPQAPSTRAPSPFRLGSRSLGMTNKKDKPNGSAFVSVHPR